MEELKVHNYNDDGDSSGCVAWNNLII
jgi:hypothetical protein